MARPRGAARRLVASLDALAERTGDAVTVVLDGGEAPPSQRVEVLVARRRGPNAADDAIVELLEQRGGEGTRVVTSDAELARRVRALGAEVEGAGRFRQRLGGEGGRRGTSMRCRGGNPLYQA